MQEKMKNSEYTGIPSYMNIREKLRHYSLLLLDKYYEMNIGKVPKDKVIRKYILDFESALKDGKVSVELEIPLEAKQVAQMIAKNSLEQRERNESGYENRLIEMPKTYLDFFKSYIKTYIKDSEEFSNGNGVDRVGLPQDEEVQFKGVVDMMLLTLISNRLKNCCEKELKQVNISSEKKSKYTKMRDDFLATKDEMMSNSLVAIWILKNTGEKYKDYFSYGEKEVPVLIGTGKLKKDSSLVFDVPYIGQISVHYGNDWKRKEIIEKTIRKIDSILTVLEKKKELPQLAQWKKEIKLALRFISKDKMYESESKEAKMFLDSILPSYEFKLYEYNAAIPLQYTGEQIEKIYCTDKEKSLNKREMHYMYVIKGGKKSRLRMAENNGRLGEITTKQNELIRGVRGELTRIRSSDVVNAQRTVQRGLGKNKGEKGER